MPVRPGDGTDLQGDVAMVTGTGQVHRLHVQDGDDGPCMYLQDLQTGEYYKVCLTLVTTETPTPVTGEVLHGTGWAYAVFGPDGDTPPTPTPPTTEVALQGGAHGYAVFGDIPA